MMSYSNLAIYYKNIFNLIQIHKYALSDIESMIPYERDLYIGMLIDFIEEENKKHKR